MELWQAVLDVLSIINVYIAEIGAWFAATVAFFTGLFGV